MIDAIDIQILTIMQNDGRISNAELARQVNLAPSAVLERIKKLEERGVIRGYTALVSPKALGFGITAFVSVKTSDCGDGSDQLLAAIPEVLEVHDVAGEDSFLLKVRASDPEGLAVLLRSFKAIPSVVSTKTTIVLETAKESSALPLDQFEIAENGRKKKQ